MVTQTKKEIMRCNMGDIITFMECLMSLWQSHVYKQIDMKSVMGHCEMYLNEYVSKAKKDIIGT